MTAKRRKRRRLYQRRKRVILRMRAIVDRAIRTLYPPEVVEEIVYGAGPFWAMLTRNRR